ncbi:carbohydrate sulfotransferase 1-like [Diadema antillarum]|uniref:carbohydrate sulfotransferase 1-like n=1 Tax=Diadema antillarum TaxID=105358 RepID=UPI003A8B4474
MRGVMVPCGRLKIMRRILHACLVCVLLTVLFLAHRHSKTSLDVAFIDAPRGYDTENDGVTGGTTQMDNDIIQHSKETSLSGRGVWAFLTKINDDTEYVTSDRDEEIQEINNAWKSFKYRYGPARQPAAGYGKRFDFDIKDVFKEHTRHLNYKTSDPPFVIVLGQWRFGSSIVGQIFNQNPEFFYMYEPLWIVDHLRNIGKLPLDFFSSERRRYTDNILHSIARCNFTSEYVDVTNTWTGIYNNDVLCSLRPGLRCRLPSPEWLGKLCSMFKGRVAIKVIRADLENIRPLIVEEKLNVKVIHLVRDPRGSAASRIRYYFTLCRRAVKKHWHEFAMYGRLAPLGLLNTTQKPKDSITRMCSWVRENLRDSSNLPDWLQGRYFLLKYEDFAEAPLKVTEDVYKFVGMPLPDKVKSWVYSHTQVGKSNTGTFDVQKNSKATAKRWMSELRSLEIWQVEAACLDVMDRLGYEPMYAKI